MSASALLGLETVTIALCAGGDEIDAERNGGHCDGAEPPNDARGTHGQLCCGEKEIEIVQLCCGFSEKDAPADGAQSSVSEKLGS